MSQWVWWYMLIVIFQVKISFLFQVNAIVEASTSDESITEQQVLHLLFWDNFSVRWVLKPEFLLIIKENAIFILILKLGNPRWSSLPWLWRPSTVWGAILITTLPISTLQNHFIWQTLFYFDWSISALQDYFIWQTSFYFDFFEAGLPDFWKAIALQLWPAYYNPEVNKMEMILVVSDSNYMGIVIFFEEFIHHLGHRPNGCVRPSAPNHKSTRWPARNAAWGSR